MLHEFYGLDKKVLFVRGVNRTLTVKRKEPENNLTSMTGTLLEEVEDGEKIYHELNQIDISDFLRDTRASLEVDGCLFGYMGGKVRTLFTYKL